MAGINKVIIVGNLGKDPEIRSFQNGGRVANFSIATSESWKKDGEKYQFAIQTEQGEKTAEASFIESGKLATSIGGNLVVFDRAN